MSEEPGWASRDPTPLTAALGQDDGSNVCLGTEDDGKHLPWRARELPSWGRKVQRKDTVAAKAGAVARLGATDHDRIVQNRQRLVCAKSEAAAGH